MMNAPTITELSDKPPTLKEAQAIVGGYVQLLNLEDDSQLLVDEEGRLKGSPLNEAASNRWPEWGALFGNVLLLKGAARWT